MDFNKSFGGSYDDELYSIQRTSDAGYIAAGRTKSYGENDYDLFLIKTDKSGNILWQKNYGGAKEDEGYSVEETGDGGYIVAGKTRSYGSGMYDVWLVKVDSAGEMTWDKTFGGALDDEASSIKETSDGGFIIAGSTKSSGSGMYDLWLLRIDRFGGKVWDKTFGGSGDDIGDSIQEISEGGFVVAGTTASWGNGDVDALLMKIDSNGNELWTKTFGGSRSERNPWSRGWSVQQTEDGGFSMLGSTNSFGSGGYDIWFIKTDARGDKVADKVYGGAYDEEGGSLVVTGEGDHILMGSTSSFGSGGYDAWLIVTDQNGEKIWDQTFGSKLDDKGYSVIKTDGGSALFAGKMKPYIAPPPRRTKGCCDDGQPGEAPTYYDGWLVGIRSAHPIIEVPPANWAACEGQEARFNVSATGNEPILYQWLKNGSQIAGATRDTYVIPAANVADAGSYQVRVSNACGFVDSTPAVLSINSKPVVEVKPLDKIACIGSEVVLDGVASGTEPLSYQWKKNGENIAGAITNRYLISAVQQADESDYTLTVSNICGVAESGAVHVAVRSRPRILVQPISQTVCAGSPVSFEVQVAGNESYAYQWQKDGQNITAANSSSLSISTASAIDQGNYSVIVSSELCGSIQSDQAELSIRSMPMITEMLLPAGEMACEGSEIALAANVTGSSPITFQWVKDGLELPGANLASYLIKSATGNDSGSYSLIVSNDCGRIESNASYLQIVALPEILLPPISQMVCEGAPATFAVQAEGTGPLSYQWFKDGIEIQGATSDAYNIPAARFSDLGSYTVLVANDCGQIESEAASLDITARPVILDQPASLKVCQGSAATFTVQTDSSEPLSYQWFKDGIEIPGAAADVYTIPAANLSDQGSYTVQVANNCSQIESDAAVLDIVAMPIILAQPASLKVCQESAAMFSVQAESSEPLSYQWFKDGIEIPGATADACTIPAANLSDLGSYTVRVANNCSQIESDAAVLDITARPMILAQPASLKVCQGSAATFTVQADSSEPLSYQWFKDGIKIPGAAADAYTIPAARFSYLGSYTVQVANNCSQIQSEAASLDIIVEPIILAQPTSLKVCQGSAATFTVQADSSEPLSYQWLKDGIEIPGAAADTYTIPAARFSDQGSYTVQVANNCRQIQSEAASLDVIEMPKILMQPANLKICPGGTAKFEVQAESTEPLSYQWFRDGIEIAGAETDRYIIDLADPANRGSYSVLVANNCSQIQSEAASLDIIVEPIVLAQPASLKVCQGTAATFSVQADSSEPLIYQWSKDGMEIPGAVADTYTIPATNLSDQGSYTMQVTNNCSQIQSEAASLDIIVEPIILAQPTSLKVCQGSAATFTVQAESSEPLSYQWFKDGIEIPGAKADTRTIPAALFSDVGSYSVQVANSCSQVESESVRLDVISPPAIHVPPASQLTCEGAAATLSVQASSSEPMEYQWYKDGEKIEGATSDAYSIPVAGPGDVGSYSVAVINSCGQVESGEAVLDIVALPEVLVSPASQKVCQGSVATLSVQAESSHPLSYQWFKDGMEIPGATQDVYVIDQADLNHTGSYLVRVANNCSQIESKAAYMEVIELPRIPVPPASQRACPGAAVTFAVQAESSEPLTYQWFKDGIEIYEATADVYTIPATSNFDTGNYSVKVRDSCGSIESKAAHLEVIQSPEILVPPNSQRVCQGDAPSFSVQAKSSEPLEYQWFKDGDMIQGATAEAFTIPNANLSDMAGYSVQIRDSCNLVESEAANLETILVPKISLQPASQTICQGTEATFTVQAESNDPLSYQWFKDGVVIPGAEAETYSIQKANPGDKGSYTVQVRNSCDQIESEPANLDIIPLPRILVQPTSQKVCEGSTARFLVSADSSQPLSYQWIKGGRTIRGANSEELIISDVSMEDMGEYGVAISNCCGFVNSDPVSLIVERPPESVDIDPDCLIADAGETVAFIMKDNANEVDSYQWEKNGEIIPGEVSTSLIILNASLSDSGGYRLTVSNSCGSKKSGMSVLRVVEDSTKIDPCQTPLSPCCNSS